jgi:hypothetical protein
MQRDKLPACYVQLPGERFYIVLIQKQHLQCCINATINRAYLQTSSYYQGNKKYQKLYAPGCRHP